MEPIPETTEAVEEDGPFTDEGNLLHELRQSAARVRELVPECIGMTLAPPKTGSRSPSVGERTRVLTLGLSDVGRDQRMKPDDRFPIQSITKSMVATLVLRLVADRELALDDTVEDVLPVLLPQGRRIAIHHLLSHRAGLHNATDEDLPPLARTTPDTFIDIAAAHPLEFAPGSSGRYSTVGYEVLGRVVERVTEQPLAVALETNVLGPAAMSDSALFGTPSVKGHFEAKKGSTTRT